MSSSSARIGLSLALLAPAALPQGGTILHDNPATTGTYGKSAFVDLDGDTYPDLVSLRDDEVDVRFALALCEVIKEGVATGVNDIATLPVTGGNPGSVVLAKNDQVQILAWDGNAIGVTVISSQGATLVARERQVGGGLRTVTLVRPDKRSVRRLTEVAPGNWSDQLLAVEAQDIFELESVDTDGDGTPEICEMVANGVAFRENDGTYIDYHIAAGAQGTVTTETTSVVQTAGSRQVIAVAVRFSAPPAADIQVISTVNESGYLYHTQFVGDTGVGGLAARDTELIPDGQADLSASWQFGHEIVQLEAEASNTSPIFDIYAPNVFNYIDYGDGPATGNVAQPALADVDGDGDIDTVLRLQDTQQDFVYLNPRVDEEGLKPILDPLITSCDYDYDTGEPLEAVQLSLEIIKGVGGTGSFNRLEVAVYEKDGPSTNHPIAVDPVCVVRTPIATDPEPNETFVFLSEAPAFQGSATFEKLVFLVMRWVEVDESQNDKVVRRGPSRVYVVSRESVPGANSDYIDNLIPGAPADPPLVYACEEVPPPPSPPGLNVAYKDSDGVPGEIGSNGDEPPCLPPPTGGNDPPKGGG